MSDAANLDTIRAQHPIGLVGSSGRHVGLGLLVALVVGCGGAPAQRPPRKMAPYAAEPDAIRYPQSLRLAALGRVHRRAGFDALAAEYFRGAYRSYPELNYMIDYAQASERADHFAEAYAAYTEALQHELNEEQRDRLSGEAERLRTLVSPSLVPVTVQVQPRQTQVLFSPNGKSGQQRMVLGDGTVWLKPGVYHIDSKAKGHKTQKRKFRVGVDERQMLAVHLRAETIAPVAIVAGKGVRPVPVAPTTTRPKPAPLKPPTATVVVAPKQPITPPAADQPPAEKPQPVAAAKPAPEEAAPAHVAPSPAEKPAEVAAVEPEKPAEAPVEAAVEPEKPAAAEKPAEPDEPAPQEEPAPAAEEGDEDDDEELDEVIEDPAPASGASGLSTWGPIATAGLGVAALGAGGYFFYTATVHAGYANDLNEKSPNYDKNFDEQSTLAQDNLDLANYAFIGGGTLVGLGTAWFVLARTLGSSAGLPGTRGDAFALQPAGIGFDGRRFIAAWRF